MTVSVTGYLESFGSGVTSSGEEVIPFWTISVSPDLYEELKGKLLYIPHAGILGRVTDKMASFQKNSVDLAVSSEEEARSVTKGSAEVFVIPYIRQECAWVS